MAEVKSIVFLKRRPGMSSDEFHKHWREVHAPKVLKLPGVTRYVQNRAVVFGDREPPFDGVAEVWFKDLESLRQAVHTEAWQVVSDDEKNFMGHTTKQSAGALTVTEDEIPVA